MNEKNPVYNRIKSKVHSMPATDLRLTAQLAGEELDMRRDRWVNKMYNRFFSMETTGMATAFRMSSPRNDWKTDRVVVNCFKDNNRSEISVGVARLAPNDKFDYYTGVAIAFARAMGESVPDLF